MQRFNQFSENIAIAARLARDLPPRLRHPIGSVEAQARVRQGVESRERRLVEVAERFVYRHSRSPYRVLLQHVGCELGDFRSLVHAEGVEGALSSLAERGVYIRIDEFKGQREVVRGSFRFSPDPRDFEHPALSPHLLLQTGGSGRQPSRVPYTLGFLSEWAMSVSIVAQAYGLGRPSQVFWWPVPLAHTMIAGMLGHPVAGWFYPVHPLPPTARIATGYLRALGRLAGSRFPVPRRCEPEQAGVLAGWLAREARDRGELLVWATPTACARLGRAAAEADLQLSGVTFLATGEPVSDARRALAEAVGAKMIAGYSSVDVSAPAYACAAPLAVDDMHVMADRCAIITRERLVEPGATKVDALLSTSLSMDSPRIAFNTETGDYGRVTRRECDCLLGRLGLDNHISEVRSFEKLTGEGVTFVRTDLERIVEHTLPARFGGSAIDYQLAEERVDGFVTRLVLRVSPTVGAPDPVAVKDALLAELRRAGSHDAYHARIWEQAGTLVVRREPPRLTSAGKVLPLDLERNAPIADNRGPGGR